MADASLGWLEGGPRDDGSFALRSTKDRLDRLSAQGYEVLRQDAMDREAAEDPERMEQARSALTLYAGSGGGAAREDMNRRLRASAPQPPQKAADEAEAGEPPPDPPAERETPPAGAEAPETALPDAIVPKAGGRSVVDVEVAGDEVRRAASVTGEFLRAGAHGVYQGGEEIWRTLHDVGSGILSFAPDFVQEAVNEVDQLIFGGLYEAIPWEGAAPDISRLAGPDPEGPYALVSALSAFALGYGVTRRPGKEAAMLMDEALGAVKTGTEKVVRAVTGAAEPAARGAIADFMTQDPRTGALGALTEAVPGLAPYIPDYLESREDDAALEARMKNVIEGAILGRLGEAAAKGAGKAARPVGPWVSELADRVILQLREVKGSWRAGRAAKNVGGREEVAARAQAERDIAAAETALERELEIGSGADLGDVEAARKVRGNATARLLRRTDEQLDDAADEAIARAEDDLLGLESNRQLQGLRKSQRTARDALDRALDRVDELEAAGADAAELSKARRSLADARKRNREARAASDAYVRASSSPLMRAQGKVAKARMEISAGHEHGDFARVQAGEEALRAARIERRRIAEEQVGARPGEDGETLAIVRPEGKASAADEAAWREASDERLLWVWRDVLRRTGRDPLPRGGFTSDRILTALDGWASRVGEAAREAIQSGRIGADVVRSLHELDAFLNKTLTDATRSEDRMADAAMARSRMGTAGTAEGEIKRKLRSRDLVAKSGGSERVRALVAAMAEANGPEDVMRLWGAWREQARYGWSRTERVGAHKTGAVLTEIRLNGMLSGIKTHAKNVVGNTAFGVLRVGEHFLADALPGGPGLREAVSRSAEEIGAIASGMSDAWFLARKDLASQLGSTQARRDIAASGMEAMYRELISTDKHDVNTRIKHTGLPEVVKDVLADRHPASQWAGRALDKTIEQAYNLPTELLQSEDVFFKVINYRAALAREAQAQADREGLTGLAWRERVNELRTAPTRELNEAAHEQARRATFTKEPDAKWMRGVMEVRKRYPAATAVGIPFMRVLSNLLDEGMIRAPLVKNLNPEYQRIKASGTQAERQAQKARTVTGWLAMMSAGQMALEGQITGSLLGTTKDEHWARYREGRRPHSVKLGDTWVKYADMASGLKATLSLSADLALMFATASNEDEYQRVMDYGHSVMETLAGFTDEHWGVGFLELLDTIGEADAKGMERWAKRLLVSQAPVPGSSLARAVNRAFVYRGDTPTFDAGGGKGAPDEGALEKSLEVLESAGREVWDTLTFGGGGFMVHSPTTGKPINPLKLSEEARASGIATFNMAFSPLVVSVEQGDRLGAELARLRVNVGWVEDYIRPRAQGFGAEEPETVELTPEERSWYSRRVGEIYQRKGTTAMDSWWYKGYTRKKQADVLVARFAEAKREALGELRAKSPYGASLRARERSALERSVERTRRLTAGALQRQRQSRGLE